MDDRRRRAKYGMYLAGELEAAATYQAMADAEEDPDRAEVFRRLVEAEMRHATRWAQELGIDPATLAPAGAGLRLRLLKLPARLLGTRRILPVLLRGEAKDIHVYSMDPEARDIAREERRHSRALRGLTGEQERVVPVHSEGGTYGGGSGSLRAAVLGVNDGLVSNLSLVMGVAGGTGNADIVLIAGVAGLLAWVTGRSTAWGALRMLRAGGSAAAVTFGVGSLIGVSLST